MGLVPNSVQGRVFYVEAKLGGQPWGTQQPPRVVVEDGRRGGANEFGLRVGRTVHGVYHREDIAGVVERDSHSVEGEVTTPQVALDGALDGCNVYLGLRAVERARDPHNAPELVEHYDGAAGPQGERRGDRRAVTLDGNVEVADLLAEHGVPDGSAGEVGALARRRQTLPQRVDCPG